MGQNKTPFHGSDLEKVEAVYGIKKESIISYAANVNPLGISSKLKETLAGHLDAITRYPDPDYADLRRVIGTYCGACPDNIICGSGATELISLVLTVRRPRKAVIIGPTYSEYEREIALGGGTSNYYPLREEEDFRLNTEEFCASLNDSLDLLVICNPNNPTGTAIGRRDMRRILDACMKNGIFVMVDETYVEFARDVNAVTAVSLTESYNNLVVLRGTSKFFASPGLRLGYAVTGNHDMLKAINHRKNLWTISSLAEIAGCIMFADDDYIRVTRELISRERDRVIDVLSRIDTIKVYPTEANFVLYRILREDVDAQQLFEYCIRRHMMVRNCASFPFLDDRYVRFCFMEPEQNDALLDTMKEILL